jgi:type I restriction enzyme, S subunit
MSERGAWPVRQLIDLAEANPSTLSAQTNPSARFRYIDLSAVSRGSILWNQVHETDFAHAPSRARRLVEQGDVLFGTVRPALQSHGSVRGHQEGSLIASTGFAVIRAKGTTDPRFLAHVILSESVFAQARRAEVGSNYPAVNESDVRKFVVPSPPFDQQRRIARVLDTIDDAIRTTEQLIAKLEQMKQGLLHDLLTRGIDESGAIRDPGLHPEQFIDSVVGLVPRDWWVGPIGAAIHLQRGFDITVADQRPGKIPVVSSSGIASYHDTAKVHGPGVVIGRKGKLGDAYFVPSDFWPHDTTLWVTAFNGNDPRFIALLLKAMRLQRYDAATSVPTLNRNFVHPIPVAVPQSPEQACIVDRILAFEATATAESASLAKLRRLKRGLMDDLLTGRVRVKVDDQDTA